MELAKKLSALQAGAQLQRQSLVTKEEAEKALLLPFIKTLGYDPLDWPETDSDYRIVDERQGPLSVDYAVTVDGSPTILFTCVGHSADLDAYEADPILQSLDETGARIGVVTNGHRYRFFANGDPALSQRGRSAESPEFLDFDLLEYGPEEVEELKLVRKSAFQNKHVSAPAARS